jgi:hypothetical protein
MEEGFEVVLGGGGRPGAPLFLLGEGLSPQRQVHGKTPIEDTEGREREACEVVAGDWLDGVHAAVCWEEETSSERRLPVVKTYFWRLVAVTD